MEIDVFSSGGGVNISKHFWVEVATRFMQPAC